MTEADAKRRLGVFHAAIVKKLGPNYEESEVYLAMVTTVMTKAKEPVYALVDHGIQVV